MFDINRLTWIRMFESPQSISLHWSARKTRKTSSVFMFDVYPFERFEEKKN